MNNNFHIGWCPFCNQGWVNVVKNSALDKLFLLCEECDTIWDNPDDLKLDNPITREFEDKLELPSTIEVQKIGWDKLIISIRDTSK
jgi:hypothetical protein